MDKPHVCEPIQYLFKCILTLDIIKNIPLDTLNCWLYYLGKGYIDANQALSILNSLDDEIQSTIASAYRTKRSVKSRRIINAAICEKLERKRMATVDWTKGYTHGDVDICMKCGRLVG